MSAGSADAAKPTAGVSAKLGVKGAVYTVSGKLAGSSFGSVRFSRSGTLKLPQSAGGAAPHGGGAFSGKDTTKVDRSAAYAERYLAKNVVAAKLAERCTIQLSYAIGVAQPLSVYVDLHGTGKVSEEEVETALRKVMDLSPGGIRRHLDLNKPIYARTAAYGHFGRKPGRDGSFSWERTDLVKPLKDAIGG